MKDHMPSCVRVLWPQTLNDSGWREAVLLHGLQQLLFAKLWAMGSREDC